MQGQEIRGCLACSLRERTERDVYVASAWHRGVDVTEKSRARKMRTMKRPEGRAPAQILVGAQNTYKHPCRLAGCGAWCRPGVRIRKRSHLRWLRQDGPSPAAA